MVHGTCNLFSVHLYLKIRILLITLELAQSSNLVLLSCHLLFNGKNKILNITTTLLNITALNTDRSFLLLKKYT